MSYAGWLLTRVAFLGLAAPLLLGCKTVTSQKAPALPAWLMSKPASDQYYIGIGRASLKAGAEEAFQQAKKRALEDIASEIKINIASVSVLSQVASDRKFYEKYEQTIRTSTADELEGYEQVENWEDAEQCAVYYRLSKQKYQELKDLKKRNAITSATEALGIADEASQNGETVRALMFYAKAIVAIEKYLLDPLMISYAGKEISLTNTLYASFYRQLAMIHLIATPPKLTARGRLADAPLVLNVLARDQKKPVNGLPLHAAFSNGAGDIQVYHETDSQGKARVSINKITAHNSEQAARIQVDLAKLLPEDESVSLKQLVVDSVHVPSVEVLIKVLRPVLYLGSSESTSSPYLELTDRLRQSLLEESFPLVNKSDQAEFLVLVEVNLVRGAIKGSLYAVDASAAFRITEAKTGRDIYRVNIDPLRDYGLDYPRAEKEAYSQLIQRLENGILSKLIDALR